MVVRIFNGQAFDLRGGEQFRIGGDECDGRQSGGELSSVKTHRNGKLNRV